MRPGCAAAVTALAVLVACGGGDPAVDAAPELSGQLVYLQLCASCHGDEAEGTVLGYELRHPVRDHAAFVIRTGRPGLEFPRASMPAFGEALVSATQLEEMLDWLDSFPQPTTGAALFADYCASCHGAGADGGVSQTDIRGATLGDITENVRGGTGGTAFEDRLLYMPALSTDVLSDEELQLVADHLASLPQP